MRTPPLPPPIAQGTKALHRAYLNGQTALFSALMLALLLVAIWYLVSEPELRALTRAEQVSASADGSDWFMEKVEMRRFNSSGALQQTLSAARISHAPDTGLLMFQAPALRVQSDSTRFWTLSARTGVADEPLQNLSLQGDVVAKRWPGVNGVEDLSLHTSQLDLDSVKQMAHTEAEVIFSRGRSELHARGLQADLAREQLQFLHEVKARYVQP